jgi:hypothetical protein
VGVFVLGGLENIDEGLFGLIEHLSFDPFNKGLELKCYLNSLGEEFLWQVSVNEREEDFGVVAWSPDRVDSLFLDDFGGKNKIIPRVESKHQVIVIHIVLLDLHLSSNFVGRKIGAEFFEALFQVKFIGLSVGHNNAVAHDLL